MHIIQLQHTVNGLYNIPPCRTENIVQVDLQKTAFHAIQMSINLLKLDLPLLLLIFHIMCINRRSFYCDDTSALNSPACPQFAWIGNTSNNLLHLHSLGIYRTDGKKHFPQREICTYLLLFDISMFLISSSRSPSVPVLQYIHPLFDLLLIKLMSGNIRGARYRSIKLEIQL